MPHRKTSLSSSENYQVFLEQEGSIEWHNRGLLFLYTVYYYLVVFLLSFSPPPFFFPLLIFANVIAKKQLLQL